MFSEWLNERIRERGLSERAIADAVGVSQQSVNRWRNGDSRPGGARIGRLAYVLEVRSDDVIKQLEAEEEHAKLTADPSLEGSLRDEIAELRAKVERLEHLAKPKPSRTKRGDSRR